MKLTTLSMLGNFDTGKFNLMLNNLQKPLSEVHKISSKFILCDHVHNSHDHSVLQKIDITRRNLMLITLKA